MVIASVLICDGSCQILFGVLFMHVSISICNQFVGELTFQAFNRRVGNHKIFLI